ncbi:MAG TPA: hypothetical protein VMW81_09295 [Nitrospinota bacterium]|nr:hypothetical protein [Nitrospinota bacterium]
MYDSLINHYTQLLKPIFPPDADFLSEETTEDAIIIKVCWYLGSDPDRKHKRSRPIKIIIPRETIEDHNLENDSDRKNADKKIFNFVKNKYKNFNPNHDFPQQEVPPAVEWIISSDLI